MKAQQFLQWVEDVGVNNLVWMTDLDHTVLDMQKDPTKVRAPAGLSDSFAALDRATEGRFFVITGREMSYVQSIFPDQCPKASTEYHNAMYWGGGLPVEELNPQPQWSLLDPALRDLTAKYWPEDFAFRDKPFMRSLHFKHAPEFSDANYKAKVKGELQQLLDTYFAQTGQRLINIDGGSVFDIAPEGSTKAAAVDDILDHMRSIFIRRMLTPVYFGDSPGDLDAAYAVQKTGGKFIAIGDDTRVTNIADFCFASTAEARDVFANAAQLPERLAVYDHSAAHDVSINPGCDF